MPLADYLNFLSSSPKVQRKVWFAGQLSVGCEPSLREGEVQDWLTSLVFYIFKYPCVDISNWHITISSN